MQTVRFIFLGCLLSIVTGCSLTGTAPPTEVEGAAIQGRVHGGQQPVAGSHVYLLAANTTGYGSASVSLLKAASTGYSDSIGAYVPSGIDGSFTITNDYSCTPNTQVYLYALGGNPGSGVNAAAGFLAVLGNCPTAGNFAAATPDILVNEVTTIAAAYAMAGFATDPLHVSSSGTALAQTGIQNAFANAANLASLSTGAALATTPAGNGTVPQQEINTLANALASCVNTSGAVTGPTNPTTCYTLFHNVYPVASVPTDTAGAAIDIAEFQVIAYGAYNNLLLGLSSGMPAFIPALNAQPNDYSIAITFTGGGLSGTNSLAIDGAGNVWANDIGTTRVSELSSAGVALSPSTGFTGGGIKNPTGVAVDLTGDVWISNPGNNSIAELSSSGAAISPATGYTGGGLTAPVGIAIDGSGNAWVANHGGVSVSEFSSSGLAISPSAGYTGGGLSAPGAIAIDASGNAWIANNTGYVTKLSSSGVALSPTTGYTGGGIYEPRGIAIDASGDAWATSLTEYVYNSIGTPGAIGELSNSGVAISSSNGFSNSNAVSPYGIAIDGYGNSVAAATGQNCIEVIDDNGQYYGEFYASGLSSPTAIAVDGSGNVWVGNTGTNSITEFIGLMAPVVTPLSVGVKNKQLGTLP